MFAQVSIPVSSAASATAAPLLLPLLAQNPEAEIALNLELVQQLAEDGDLPELRSLPSERWSFIRAMPSACSGEP